MRSRERSPTSGIEETALCLDSPATGPVSPGAALAEPRRAPSTWPSPPRHFTAPGSPPTTAIDIGIAPDPRRGFRWSRRARRLAAAPRRGTRRELTGPAPRPTRRRGTQARRSGTRAPLLCRCGRAAARPRPARSLLFARDLRARHGLALSKRACCRPAAATAWARRVRRAHARARGLGATPRARPTTRPRPPHLPPSAATAPCADSQVMAQGSPRPQARRGMTGFARWWPHHRALAADPREAARTRWPASPWALARRAAPRRAWPRQDLPDRRSRDARATRDGRGSLAPAPHHRNLLGARSRLDPLAL